MNIYTAHYRYAGPDRLDITVKGNTPPGQVLAPTWEMVKAYKAQEIDSWQYSVKYFALIMKRILTLSDYHRLMWDEIESKSTITLVCFCPPGLFCHRTVAAQLLAEVAPGTYHGERHPQTY